MSSIYDKSSLVLIPSGTKTGKVFSQKPVSGDGDFTFTRASAATRVNADGNIEKETGNLLTYSNTFTSGWGAIGSSVTSGQSGYDGTSDAWLLSKTAGSGRLFIGVSESGVNTYSVYVKADALNWVRIMTNGSNTRDMYFDLANGALGTSTYGGQIDATITSVGGGWYRCTISVNETITLVRIYPAQNDGFVGGTSGSIYIQDAQLEQGLVARDVITTTTTALYGGITDNTPRLDYTDSSCPALLLEPLRTNVLANSEYFNGTPYTIGNSAITANAALSPEGVQNAYNFVPDTTGTPLHRIYDGQSSSIQTATHSIFIKPNGHNYYALRESATTGASIGFDFTDNSIIVEYSTGGCTASGGKIEQLENGWYRISGTFSFSSATPNGFGLYAAASNWTSGDVQSVSWAGNGVDGAYIYGAQLEAGSYATSYIPTYGSSVTRVGDACVKTGISSLIGQTEGTIFYEVNIPSLSTAGNDVNMSISDGTSNNAIYMAYYNIGRVQAVVFLGGSLVVNINLFGYGLTEGVHKFALAYKNNDYNFFIDGASVGTDISAGVPATNQLSLVNGAGEPSIRYRQSLLFKTRLTNAELATLTTI